MGAQRCHSRTTAAARAHGQLRKNVVQAGAGWVRIRNSVTTPNWALPPPRSAQNRSGSRRASTSRIRPSAVTIRAPVRLSLVSPYARLTTPMPPPSARPATPTVGHDPAGTVRRRAVSRSYTSMSFAPAPICAVPPGDIDTDAIGCTSTTSPGPDDHPAYE